MCSARQKTQILGGRERPRGNEAQAGESSRGTCATTLETHVGARRSGLLPRPLRAASTCVRRRLDCGSALRCHDGPCFPPLKVLPAIEPADCVVRELLLLCCRTNLLNITLTVIWYYRLTCQV